ncbi:MAG: hypothetical protein ACHQUC_07685 [Chlamydiales bacterium]
MKNKIIGCVYLLLGLGCISWAITMEQGYRQASKKIGKMEIRPAGYVTIGPDVAIEQGMMDQMIDEYTDYRMEHIRAGTDGPRVPHDFIYGPTWRRATFWQRVFVNIPCMRNFNKLLREGKIK